VRKQRYVARRHRRPLRVRIGLQHLDVELVRREHFLELNVRGRIVLVFLDIERFVFVELIVLELIVLDIEHVVFVEHVLLRLVVLVLELVLIDIELVVFLELVVQLLVFLELLLVELVILLERCPDLLRAPFRLRLGLLLRRRQHLPTGRLQRREPVHLRLRVRPHLHHPHVHVGRLRQGQRLRERQPLHRRARRQRRRLLHLGSPVLRRGAV
jgi:hypothetical protein